MKRLLVALVLVCGLSSAVGAQAGGWIEWARFSTSTYEALAVAPHWFPVGGYPTAAECAHEQAKDVASMNELVEQRLKRSPDADPLQLTYRCFPSDFDPIAKNSGGWVLWNQTTVLSKQDQTGKEVSVNQESWEPREGFDQLADCRKEAADQIRKVGGAAAENAKKPDPLFLSSVAINSSAFYEMRLTGGGKGSYRLSTACFPGGLDPRPR